ncbi:aminotransferase class IV [Nioella nitratireducens]|uniref:aminotransferase class IV n=1 Tax=Nioella nitratireducens TaxID=1287720 RepID=UPI0008FD5E79|nr:aminotransferase class IV [Nioella nitratireducens]
MADLSKGAAWMKGEILPISEAKIGVTDWGVTHSDIAYDVVPVVSGGFFRLDAYLDRFMESLAAVRMDVGLSRAGIAEALHQMVAASGLRDAYCAMVAARGVPMIPGSRDPRDCGNHFYAWAVPYIHVIRPEVIAAGAKLWIAKDVRRIPADSVNPRAKNYHWGDFTQGLFEAKDNGFETVVLLDHQGNLTEGPGFNIFVIEDGIVRTPDTGILEGVSRRTALEICTEMGLETRVEPVPLDRLWSADEVFLTSSGGGILPIAQVDERLFGNGKPGPLAPRARDIYWDWVARPAYRTEIAYPA